MIPENELAHVKFENPGYVAKETIILFSTPRSGSTLLCTDIDPNFGAPAAEYFQPFQILPYLLKSRPSIADGELISSKRYAEYLMRYRSGPSEKLFINLHASHIKLFCKVEKNLPRISKRFLLFRENILAQGVSYAIAKQNKMWSSTYPDTNVLVSYKYDLIRQCIFSLIAGYFKNINHLKNKEYIPISYELYCKEKHSFANICGVEKNKSHHLSTVKQSKEQNEAFINRFKEEKQKKLDTFLEQMISKYEYNISRFK